MSEKIELKDKLAAIDLGAKNLWDDINDEQRKALKSELFILNRYISNVKGQSREVQEHFVLTVNEYYNKHWNTLQKHPKLLWQLLCMCSHESRKLFFHEWLSFKRKKTETKKVKFLSDIYPNRKQDELELLAEIMTTKELKDLAFEHGYEDKEIEKLF
ncbi:hypothetical protein EBU71_08180 [bacterium]|nr:hypothetical protein [Candidatus Elulimicrobium humile]